MTSSVLHFQIFGNRPPEQQNKPYCRLVKCTFNLHIYLFYLRKKNLLSVIIYNHSAPASLVFTAYAPCPARLNSTFSISKLWKVSAWFYFGTTSVEVYNESSGYWTLEWEHCNNLLVGENYHPNHHLCKTNHKLRRLFFIFFIWPTLLTLISFLWLLMKWSQ